ncbi:hypothetical protein NC651_031095 [Populus alba x Populus x berolinensis]|nr:hypothetical protein NC651_031095 [Populus alba x Populus x berolinensis]
MKNPKCGATYKVAAWLQSANFQIIHDGMHSWENNRLLGKRNWEMNFGAIKEKPQALEKEQVSCLEKISESSQNLATVALQKENSVKDFILEADRRIYLEKEDQSMQWAFASRQRSFMSFQG